MPWHKVKDHSECSSDEPWAVVKDNDGTVEGCHATEAEADDQIAALNASEDDGDSASRKPTVLRSEALAKAEDDGEGMEFSEVAYWEGTICVEGITSGDQREFAEGALTWADLPVPLRWNIEDSHGGMPQTKAVLVGAIDNIWRDGSEIKANGRFDLGGEHGREAHRLVENDFLKGVSIDADSIAESDIEYVYAEPDEDENEDDEMSVWDMLFPELEKVLFHAGRIRAATLCDIPAFSEAYIWLAEGNDPPEGYSTSSAEELAGKRMLEEVKQELTAAAVMHMADLPDADWFQNPQLPFATPITVTPEGRVYGHAALWGQCHISHTDACVTPPEEDYHAHYLTGELLCADGSVVAVGQITVGTGHAPLGISARTAAEHYDNTGAAVADVAVGNDAHGIWVAGAVRPDAAAARVRDLRAAGQVSGDWRRIGGQLRLVGLLAVNVPGFPVPKLATRVASGAQLALVAAGQPRVIRITESEEDLNRRALKLLQEELTRQVMEGRN